MQLCVSSAQGQYRELLELKADFSQNNNPWAARAMRDFWEELARTEPVQAFKEHYLAQATKFKVNLSKKGKIIAASLPRSSVAENTEKMPLLETKSELKTSTSPTHPSPRLKYS